MFKDVIGLLDCHNSPALGQLTANRPLASTSFLGRYAFADFALSNFCNSGIQTVGILVKDHQRSILKHLGNMTAWVTNTKIGHQTILFNEKGALNPATNSDINNIRENDWVLYDSKASYLIFRIGPRGPQHRLPAYPRGTYRPRGSHHDGLPKGHKRRPSLPA